MHRMNKRWLGAVCTDPALDDHTRAGLVLAAFYLNEGGQLTTTNIEIAAQCSSPDAAMRNLSCASSSAYLAGNRAALPG